MSLINDALRRASKTEKERTAQPAAPLAMEPVAPSRKKLPSALLGVLIVVVLALAGWFFWQWWSARHAAPKPVLVKTAPAPAPAKVVPPPVLAPKPAPVVQTPVPVPAPVIATNAPPIVPQVKPMPAPADDGLIAWPDLKITAIFYSQKNPHVMISGDVYGEGDQVKGVTVKKIEKDRVIIECNGRTKVLY